MEKPIVTYIRELQRKEKLKDNELAEKLGIKPPSLCVIKQGKTVPKDSHCLKLAKIAGDPPEKVLLLAAESRAPKESRPLWEKIAKASGFGAVVLAVTLASSPVKASAPQCVVESRSVDIMSNKRKRRRRRPHLSLRTASA